MLEPGVYRLTFTYKHPISGTTVQGNDTFAIRAGEFETYNTIVSKGSKAYPDFKILKLRKLRSKEALRWLESNV